MNNLLKKHEPTIVAEFMDDKGKLTVVGENCEQHGITQKLLDSILLSSEITPPPNIIYLL